MGIVVRERAAHESALMEHKQRLSEVIHCRETQLNPLIRQVWEKCSDLKGEQLCYKDWNCATQTNRDPQRSVKTNLDSQFANLSRLSVPSPNTRRTVNSVNIDEISKEPGVESAISLHDFRVCSSFRTPPGLESLQTLLSNEGDRFSEVSDENFSSMIKDNDHSLELTLNLPGSSMFKPTATFSQAESMCTIEKVRTALERMQWSSCTSQISRKRAHELRQGLNMKNVTEFLSLSPLSLSSSKDSTVTDHLQSDTCPKSSITSPSASQECSSSESHLTSTVFEDSQGDEEVHQPNASSGSGENSQVYLMDGLYSYAGDGVSEMMVAVGCRSCLMYVMLSNSHPCCPRCGNADEALLELPGPQLKKQRTTAFDCSSLRLSWCTA